MVCGAIKMKLSTKLENAFNKQLNFELFSGYLYLSMAAYLESQNLTGMATWMKKQFEEEQMHAMKLFDYIQSRGNNVVLNAIAKPKTTWKSPLDVFQESLKHEQLVTKLINSLFVLATKENDTAAQVLLQWYVNEQVEEESTVETIIHKLKMIGSSGNGLLMLDYELAKRV